MGKFQGFGQSGKQDLTYDLFGLVYVQGDEIESAKYTVFVKRPHQGTEDQSSDRNENEDWIGFGQNSRAFFKLEEIKELFDRSPLIYYYKKNLQEEPKE
jgi:hypothetical protein